MDGKEGDASEADPDLIAELEALIEQVKANEIVGVSSLYFIAMEHALVCILETHQIIQSWLAACYGRR